MRILTSLTLVALVLTLPWNALAAPFFQASIDIKTLALAKGDLPRGFDVVPDRTVSEERPDGVAVYDVTYARERTPENLSAGPFEVRSGVARTAQPDDAKAQLASTRDAFVAEGWTEAPVPALGDEKIGLTQTTDGDGGKLSHFAYLFRKGTLILMIGVRGRPDVTKMDDAVSLAILVSGRVDKALSGGGSAAPAAAPASGNTASSPATVGRVRVVNADGGSVNMRSDASASADVVAEVAEGTVLDLVGPDKDGDGRTWRNVKTSDGKTGWIASTLLETVAAPTSPASPSVAPSPAPSPAAGPAPAANPSASSAAPSTDSGAAPADAGSTAAPSDVAPPQPAASPQAAPSGGAAPASSSATTGRATGNGLIVETSVRDATLSNGTQLVKVHVTRDPGGGGVSGAFVDVTAKLDANRFRSIRLPKTNDDGWTEIEWDMEGPAGNYQVIADVRTDENGPATTATTSFRWK